MDSYLQRRIKSLTLMSDLCDKILESVDYLAEKPEENPAFELHQLSLRILKLEYESLHIPGYRSFVEEKGLEVIGKIEHQLTTHYIGE